MKNKDVIELEQKNTISFFELLKMKIINQSENTAKGLDYFSIFLSVFNMFSLNSSYAIIGNQSKIFAVNNSNFWIVLIMLIPYIFMSGISFVFSLLSKYLKTEFLGKLAFYLSIFDFFVVLFFLVFIPAVF